MRRTDKLISDQPQSSGRFILANSTLSELLQLWRGRRGRRGPGGHRRQLLAGKVILERSEEVADDGNAPGLPQNLLPLLPVHVPNVRVVFGETKDPEEEETRHGV